MHHSRLLSLFNNIIFCLLIFACFNAKAYDERFTLKIQDKSISLNINLKDGHKIYWQKSGDTGLPTVIDFTGSTNLASYHLRWPAPNVDILGDITNYTCSGEVIIPIDLNAADASKSIGLHIDLNYVICGNQCVPVKQTVESEVMESSSNLKSFFSTLLAAFMGGFILNFMPCVLPVIALKLMLVTKAEGNYRLSFAITLLGIMTSFWALAIASIFMKNTGEQLGIGLGFQQVEFIIFLCIIITIFISLILSKTQIQLPEMLLNFAIPKTSRRIKSSLSNPSVNSNFLESFTGGVIATLLSVPCTAPFLGSAMLIAVISTPLESLLIFTSMGLGFGLPYVLLIASPRLLNSMPKPGPWMNKAKKIMAMLFIASLFWLLWLIYGQLGLRATFGLFLILMLIKFIFEEVKIRAKLFCIIVLIASALYLPQLAYREDVAFETYSDQIWIEFDREKLNELFALGKTIVIEVTADWCLTCKYNKFMVWDRAKMLKLLSQPEIVAMRADATIYRKDIENYLKEFGVHGIPLTVIYSPKYPHGLVMPTLVDYDDVKKAITERP